MGAKRLPKLPPERLPRRAVRGLGAHSPHQTGAHADGEKASRNQKRNRNNYRFQVLDNLPYIRRCHAIERPLVFLCVLVLDWGLE